MTDSAPVAAASPDASTPPPPVSPGGDPAAPEGPAHAPEPAGAGDRLSRTGRWVRVVVTVAGCGLLLAGTLWGQDDHFPFGPFRMFAHSAKRDGVVNSARLEAVNAEGERFRLSDTSTGLRRAEIEGQMGRFRADGRRLEAVADAYADRHPDAPPLVLVEILQRRYQLEDGEPSGEVSEGQVAAWVAPGYEALADYDDRVEGAEPTIVAAVEAGAGADVGESARTGEGAGQGDGAGGT